MPSIKRFIKKPRSYPPQDSNRPGIHANVFTQSGSKAAVLTMLKIRPLHPRQRKSGTEGPFLRAERK
jgi:hypothetical protein